MNDKSIKRCIAKFQIFSAVEAFCLLLVLVYTLLSLQILDSCCGTRGYGAHWRIFTGFCSWSGQNWHKAWLGVLSDRCWCRSAGSWIFSGWIGRGYLNFLQSKKIFKSFLDSLMSPILLPLSLWLISCMINEIFSVAIAT